MQKGRGELERIEETQVIRDGEVRPGAGWGGGEGCGKTRTYAIGIEDVRPRVWPVITGEGRRDEE